MIILSLIIFVFIISGGLILVALNKASKICKQVRSTQPDFLKKRSRYDLMIKIDDTQFILYILSGDYKDLNKDLIDKCNNVKRIFLVAAAAFIILILSLIIFFHFMATLT